MRVLITLPILCALGALSALPPAASAAVAGQSAYFTDEIVYSADPGETNHVTLSRVGDQLVIDDPGATRIDPQRGCTSTTPNRVACRLPQDGVTVDLGDGDDEASSGDLGSDWHGTVSLFGEQGNDTLTGTATTNFLDGGTGEDVLRQGTGTDGLQAVESFGPGSPFEMPTIVPDHDRITCVAADPSRPGTRYVSVDEQDEMTGPCGQVAVYTHDAVVSTGTDGPDLLSGSFYPTRLYGRGGNDRLFGTGTPKNRMDGGAGNDQIESGGLLLGGPGDDRLSAAIANDIPVREDGGPGNDVLLGRYGPDTLIGGPGRDRISGNAGNDRIRARDGERDSIHCGDGFDRVDADRIDVVAHDCERVMRHR